MFSYGEVPYGQLRLLSFTEVKNRSLAGDQSGSDVYYALKHGNRLEKPKHCSLVIYQVMLKCWQWDEEKRPSFEELLLHLQIDSQATLSPARKSLSREQSHGREAEHFVQF